MATEKQLADLDTANAAIGTVVRGLVEDDVNFHAITPAMLTHLDFIINQHPHKHVRDGTRALFSAKLLSGNL